MATRVTLQSRFPEIAAEMRPRVTAAIKAGAELIAEDAKSRAPRSSGPGYGAGKHENEHMADHIEVKRMGAGRYRVGPPKEFFYATFVEYGTVYTPAHPFLVPAFESKKEEIIIATQRVLQTL